MRTITKKNSRSPPNKEKPPIKGTSPGTPPIKGTSPGTPPIKGKIYPRLRLHHLDEEIITLIIQSLKSLYKYKLVDGIPEDKLDVNLLCENRNALSYLIKIWLLHSLDYV